MGAADDDDEGEHEFGMEDDDEAAASPAAAKANTNDAASAAAANYARRDAPHSSSSSSSSSSSNDSSVVFSPELLGVYYSRLFPYDLLHSWLSYDPSSIVGNVSGKGGKAVVTPAKASSSSSSPSSSMSSTTFPRREFSMTIEPSPGQEVYIRYQSFSSRDDLASAVIKRRPTKIDIGAVFNHPPKDNKSLPPGRLRTVERELVFDIDLTDYDAVRNCGCRGAKICPKCWTYMGMAMEVMDAGLREDFGFEHVSWFYSGRRGVHCWVCDGAARGLSNEARSAVASYFEINLGSDKNKGMNLSSPLHPALSRAHSILEPHFVKRVLPEDGHGLLATRASWTKLLLTLPKAAHPVASKLEERWRSPRGTGGSTTPGEKWIELKSELASFASGGRGGGGAGPAAKASKSVSSTDRARIEMWPVETVFRHAYPRLDINVSKMQNHLLKSPFCVHPKTGRVCVPIDPRDFASFDPFAVPTLADLMRELDEYDETRRGEGAGGDGGKDAGVVAHEWQKTSLRGPFESFQRKFLVPLLNDERRAMREERERRAAVVGDF